MSDITNYKYDIVYKLKSSNNEYNVITNVIPKQLPTEKLNDSYGYYVDTIDCKITYTNTLTLRVYRRIGDSTERTKVYEDTNFKFLTFNYRCSFIVDEVEADEKVLFQILNLNDEEHIPLKYSLAKLEYDIDTDREQHVDVYIKKSADSDDSYVRLYQCVSASSTGELVKASISSLEQGVEYTIRIYHYETGQELEFPITGLYEFKSGNNIVHDDYIIGDVNYNIKHNNVKKEIYSTIVDDNNDMFFPLVGDAKSLLNPTLKLIEHNIDSNDYRIMAEYTYSNNAIGLNITKDKYVEFPNDPNDQEHRVNYNNFFPTVATDRYVYFFKVYINERKEYPLISFTHNGVVRSIKVDFKDGKITTFNGTSVYFVVQTNWTRGAELWYNVLLSTNSKGEIGYITLSNTYSVLANQTLSGLLLETKGLENVYPIDKTSKFTYKLIYYTANATVIPNVEKGLYCRLHYSLYNAGGNKIYEDYGEPVVIEAKDGLMSYTTLNLEIAANTHEGVEIGIRMEIIGTTGQSPITADFNLYDAFYIIESDGLKINIKNTLIKYETDVYTSISRTASGYISKSGTTTKLKKFIIGVDQIRYPIEGYTSGDLSCKVAGINSDASIRFGGETDDDILISSVGRRIVHNINKDDVFLPYDYMSKEMYEQLLHKLSYEYPRLIGKLDNDRNGIKYERFGRVKLINEDSYIINIPIKDDYGYKKGLDSYRTYDYGFYKDADLLDYKKITYVTTEELISAGFGLHFNVDTKEQFESVINNFVKLFYTNNYKEYNKLDGGINGQLIYADFNERCIVIEAHGDKYVGNVPALSSNTYNKGYGLPLDILDVPNDYIGGITKQPVIRVGGVITYYKYTGHGSYTATIKIPKGFNGATVGIRISYNKELNKVVDYDIFNKLVSGSEGYDYNKVVKDKDGYKTINIDNNIDFNITSKPSNVYITKLPTDDTSNWYLPSITQLQTLVTTINGIHKLYKIDWNKSNTVITNKLTGLTVYEPADPQCYLTTKELFWIYVKDIDSIDGAPTNVKFRSTVTNNKEVNPINDDISSLSPRFFEMYNNIDSDLITIINDEQLTTFADDEWHEYKLLIQTTNIQLIIDGKVVGYIEKVIPYTPLRFSIGCWFPSIDISDTEAIENKEYGTYAGVAANWDIKCIKIRDIGYSGEAPSFIEPESIPFDGIRTIKQLN